jgi:hypothetical protein
MSARQLRRAAEIKEEIQSLESQLNRLTDSPDTDGIHIVPRRPGRLRAAVKAGIFVAAAPAQRLKRQLGSAARAKFAAAARSRLERVRNIEIA